MKCYINNQWKWRHYLDVRHKDPEYIRQCADNNNSNSEIVEEHAKIFKEPPEMEIMHKNKIISVPADFNYPPEDIIYPPQIEEFTEELPLSPLVRLSNAASFLFGFMVPKIDWSLRIKEGHWLRKYQSEEQFNLERKRKFIETEGRESESLHSYSNSESKNIIIPFGGEVGWTLKAQRILLQIKDPN
jgi:hypothetical protein